MVQEDKSAGKTNDRNKLEDLGVIFLTGPINDSTAETVCKSIIEINLAGKHDHIQMIINSVGGHCAAGFAIIDIMEWSALPVYTSGLGMVASMGLLIFMAGEKGHRIITPRTSILSHRFWSIEIGNHSQLLAVRKQHDIEHRRIIDHYTEHTRIKTMEELQATLLRDVDTWLTPEEAVQYGLADAVEERTRNRRRARLAVSNA